jgi:hypothetical protein
MLKVYMQIFWFKGHPEDLPTDRKFLWINLGIYMLLGLFIQANIMGLGEAFIQIVVEICITLIFLGALILKDGSTYHFERFITAILVCENFVYILALPLAFWFIFEKGTATSIYPIYIGVLLIIWSIAIISYLFKGLFNFDKQISNILSVAYFVLTYFGSFILLLMF